MFLLCFGAYTFAHSPTRRAPRLTYRQFGFKHAMPMRAKNIRNREMWHFLGVERPCWLSHQHMGFSMLFHLFLSRFVFALWDFVAITAHAVQ